MTRNRFVRYTLPIYLIPLMIGLAGILFSRQFASPAVRTLLVLASVSGAVFAAGNAIARLHVPKAQRLVLAVGAVMVAIGGAATLIDWSSEMEMNGWLEPLIEAPPQIWEISSWLGVLGLILGLLLLLSLAVRREEQVTELARHFSSLAEHIGEGFIMTQPDGSVSIVNRRMAELTGLDEEELHSERGQEFIETLGLSELIARARHHKPGDTIEDTLPWDDERKRRYFLTTVAPIFSQGQRYEGALATMRDVTELREMSQRLKRYSEELEQIVQDRTRRLSESEERLRGLLVNMSEAFVTLDGERRVRFANAQFARLIGVEESGAAGMDIVSLVAEPDRQRFHALVERAIEGERAPREEYSLVRPDGGELQVVVAASGVRAKAHEGAHASLVITDVSALKAAQEELRDRARELEAANEELLELDRAKDAFLTNVSHELRTPLSTIRGYVEMLESQEKETLSKTGRKALSVMDRNADRLGRLIEELIDFSRMQIRGMQLLYGLVDGARLIEEAAESLRPIARDNDVSINVEFGPRQAEPSEEAFHFWCDRNRILQVLTVLASNAIKFSHAGDAVVVRLWREGADACMAVVDEGIGVDPAHHARIFEKFYQVDSSLSRRYEGAGIGLSIAQAIAAAHGGRIELESALEQGSAFTLILPGTVFDQSLEQASLGAIRRRRIMLVQDGTETMRALAKVLSEDGVDVWTPAGAHEALRQLAAEAPDVLVLPDTDKDMSCTQAVDRVRSDLVSVNTRVVVLAGAAMGEEQRDALRRDGAVLLNRPFTMKDLCEAAGTEASPQDDPTQTEEDY